MRLYPPFKKITVKIEKPDEFYQCLKDNIEQYGEDVRKGLMGKLDKSGSRVEKKLKYNNSGRSIIRGKFEKGTDDYLTVYLEFKNGPAIMIALFIFLFLISVFGEQNTYLIPIVFLLSITFYFFLWLLYFVDLPVSKIEMNKIIQKANPHYLK